MCGFVALNLLTVGGIKETDLATEHLADRQMLAVRAPTDLAELSWILDPFDDPTRVGIDHMVSIDAGAGSAEDQVGAVRPQLGSRQAEQL